MALLLFSAKMERYSMSTRQNFMGKPIEANKTRILLRRVVPAWLKYMVRSYKVTGKFSYPWRPETFNQHILHRLAFNTLNVAEYIDKASARDKVAVLLGERYVPKRYLLTDSPHIPWDTLPDAFVISATHGSAMTMVINDKASVDRAAAEELLRQWLATDHAAARDEPLYKGIKPQLLVEENLCVDGVPPIDYKFHCFHGEPTFVQLDIGRFSKQTRIHYDMTWQPLPFTRSVIPMAEPQPEPQAFGEMKALAQQLSQGFDYVRVDFYAIGGIRVIFGEWTFSSAGGRGEFDPPEWDTHFGHKISNKAT
jgi:hypothetical protein